MQSSEPGREEPGKPRKGPLSRGKPGKRRRQRTHDGHRQHDLERLLQAAVDGDFSARVISSVAAGDLWLHFEDLDLLELVQEAVRAVRGEAEPAGCEIRVRANSPEVTGRCDRERIFQAVTNLLTNAIKWGRDRPIEVTIHGDGVLGRISVRDHGPGVPGGVREKIFERFGRAEALHHFGGGGLGLWTSRQIAQAHGGTVTVVSGAGEGSEFILELPLRPAVALEAVQ